MLKYLNTFLRILLGIVFLLSGYLKLFPIEAFEYNFVSIGVSNWNVAPVFARLLIGVEFALGAFLIFNIRTQRFTIPSVLALLVVFTVYLFYQLVTEGNDINCGCFGTYLEMTPVESIIKNGMMSGIAIWLILTKSFWSFNNLPRWLHDKYTGTVLSLIALSLPFILNPIGSPTEKTDEFVGKKLPLDALYDSSNSNQPIIDLRKGKHVLALFSLKCPHCKITALKMNVMYKRHPDLPFYYLLRGKAESRLRPFFKESQYSDVPYMIYNTDDFFYIANGAVPAVYVLENGLVVRSETMHTLNEDTLLNWLRR